VTEFQTSENKITVGLTDQQKDETREIVVAAMREYWTEDAIKRLAAEKAEARVNDLLQHGIAAKVAGLVEHNPESVMSLLFRQSGMVVKTKSSEYFDGIVGELLKNEASGIPEAIRDHVKLHLTELAQRSVSEIVAAMVVNFIKNDADALASSSRQMIEEAFRTASIRSY
jgi:hypothetical protein